MSSSSTLPPPGNLPSWSRVSALDRTRYPKPFLRDRIALPPGGGTITTDAMIDFGSSLNNVDVKFIEGMSAPDHLVNHNKSIAFLQQQHADTLKQLHEEIDKLKKENKALQFKFILANGNTSPQEPGQTPTESEKMKLTAHTIDTQSQRLQEEVKELRKALKESNTKNDQLYLTVSSLQQRKAEESGIKVKSPNYKINQSIEQVGDSERVSRHRRKYSVSTLSSPLPLNATLNPLKVRDGLDKESRIPTMSECEQIIQQLHETNCQQLAELSRLRMDVRDSLSSRNSTPEPYLLKTYGVADYESFSDTRLPRIPVRPIIKKSIASADSTDRVVTLPALKNSISTNVADRRKRQQAVQKARSRREFQ